MATPKWPTLFLVFGKAPHGNGEADEVHDAQETVHLAGRAQSFDLHAKLERAQMTRRWTVEAAAPPLDFDRKNSRKKNLAGAVSEHERECQTPRAD